MLHVQPSDAYSFLVSYKPFPGKEPIRKDIHSEQFRKLNGGKPSESAKVLAQKPAFGNILQAAQTSQPKAAPPELPGTMKQVCEMPKPTGTVSIIIGHCREICSPDKSQSIVRMFSKFQDTTIDRIQARLNCWFHCQSLENGDVVFSISPKRSSNKSQEEVYRDSCRVFLKELIELGTNNDSLDLFRILEKQKDPSCDVEHDSDGRWITSCDVEHDSSGRWIIFNGSYKNYPLDQYEQIRDSFSSNIRERRALEKMLLCRFSLDFLSRNANVLVMKAEPSASVILSDDPDSFYAKIMRRARGFLDAWLQEVETIPRYSSKTLPMSQVFEKNQERFLSFPAKQDTRPIVSVLTNDPKDGSSMSLGNPRSNPEAGWERFAAANNATDLDRLLLEEQVKVIFHQLFAMQPFTDFS
jgi:hypothetical protein